MTFTGTTGVTRMTVVITAVTSLTTATVDALENLAEVTTMTLGEWARPAFELATLLAPLAPTDASLWTAMWWRCKGRRRDARRASPTARRPWTTEYG